MTLARVAARSPRDSPGSRQVLVLLRLAWAACLILIVVLYVAALVIEVTQPVEVCPALPCVEAEAQALLRGAGISPTAYFVYQLVIRDVIIPLGFVALGLLIFWRNPAGLMGLAVSVALVLYGTYEGTGIMSFSIDAFGLSWLQLPLEVLFNLALSYMLFSFPDGRLWPRWALAPMLALTVAALLLDQGAGPVMLLLLGLALVLQLVRYRRLSTLEAKQQIKGALFGLAGLIANAFLWIGVVEPSFVRGAAALPTYVIFLPFSAVLALSFPVSLALSILRYRLWDIDLIIRRALIYAVLTGLLALIYFGTVAILQSVLTAVIARLSTPSGLWPEGTGPDAASRVGPVATVISTLALAALFSPLRRRVQQFIDHRFFRRKYDAARTLAEFASTARGETDLAALSSRLVSVIEETIQPAQISLWLRQTREDPAGRAWPGRFELTI